jgi:hypothetical protein
MSAKPVEPLRPLAERAGDPAARGAGPEPGRPAGTRRSAAEMRSLDDAEIMALRRRAAEAELAPELEEELSVVLGLAHELKGADHAAARLNFIVDCLVADPPKLALAQDERLRLQVENHRHSGPLTRWLARLSAGSPVALMLIALGCSLVIWSVVFALLGLIARVDAESALRMVDTMALATVSYAALVGGVLSIATRLKEFSKVRDLDPFAMFWTALLKPLIGVVLAIFLLAAIYGEVISFGALFGAGAFEGYGSNALPRQTIHVLWVIGFLAGFSERFAWDFVDRARGQVGNELPAPGTSRPGD